MKRGRENGIKNYDNGKLLPIIAEMLPTTADEWDEVAVVYGKATEEPYSRVGKNLKRHFMEHMVRNNSKEISRASQVLATKIDKKREGKESKIKVALIKNPPQKITPSVLSPNVSVPTEPPSKRTRLKERQKRQDAVFNIIPRETEVELDLATISSITIDDFNSFDESFDSEEMLPVDNNCLHIACSCGICANHIGMPINHRELLMAVELLMHHSLSQEDSEDE